MIIHNEWLFVTCIAIFSLITFLQVHFSREVRLLTKSIFTYRYTNLWLRESNRHNISLCLFIVFIFVFSVIFSHPSWLESEKWDFNLVLNSALLLIFFLALKYLIISWIGHLFQKVYLFEEIIFMSFSFEKILGLFYFPIFQRKKCRFCSSNDETEYAQ